MSIRQHIKNEVQKPMRNVQHIKLKGIDKIQSLALAFFPSKAWVFYGQHLSDIELVTLVTLINYNVTCGFFSLLHMDCDIVIDQCHQYHPTLCHPSAAQFSTAHNKASLAAIKQAKSAWYYSWRHTLLQVVQSDFWARSENFENNLLSNFTLEFFTLISWQTFLYLFYPQERVFIIIARDSFHL